MKKIAMAIIWLYQATLSGLLGPRCRFYPSCSNYAIEAIDKYGMTRGGYMALKRICKCHPLHPGGIDMVPNAPDSGTGGGDT